MSFMLSPRRIVSSLAASAALCGLTAEANAQFSLKGPGFPDFCIPFDTTQSRHKYPYDIVLNQVLRRLKAYSAWPEIQSLVKATIPIDGLCPDNDIETTFEVTPETRSVSIRTTAPETKTPLAPETMAVLIHADKYHVAGMIAGNLMGLASQFNGPRIIDENDSMIERVVLLTAARATIISEQLLLGAEMAIFHGETGEIEFNAQRLPQLQDQIFMLILQSGVAKAQGTLLSEEDKTAFRQSVYTAHLKNIAFRTDILKMWAQEHYNDMEENAQKGLPVKAPENKKFNLSDVKAKLERFPGHLADTVFLKEEYDHHWQMRATEDIAPFMMQILRIKSDTINAAIRKRNAAATPSPD